MIFPIGDEQVKGGHKPLFSYSFILLNIVIFLFKVSMQPDAQAELEMQFGAVPADITSGRHFSTLFTSMFMHGDWMHLIGNMLFLWVFADNIEATVGNVRFLLFYFLGGLVASAGHIWFNWYSTLPMVGASGAISAVMGAYLVMFPGSRIKLLLIIFPFYVTAWIFLGLWILQQWMAGTTSLTQAGTAGGVAWWAHIGGFAFGLMAGFFFRASGRMNGVELESNRA